MSKKRLMVVAGGTGGHIFPGLAVAQHLMMQGWQVRWLGTANHMEASLVPNYGIEIDCMHIEGLCGKSLKVFLSAPLKILNAWSQARGFMMKWKPDIVLGMGGYVSGPGGLAAWSFDIPIVVHEQNSVAGMTNKWLAKLSNKVIQAFPGAFIDADVVGNPIRADLLMSSNPQQRLANREGPIRVLVIGGSQGARILNQVLPEVARLMGDSITIWHQTGKDNQYQVITDYEKIGQKQHRINEFILDIAKAYVWADLVICRSGALTVSEVAVVGLPAIFVPFQHKDRHQYLNALPLEKVGAALILDQSQFTATVIARMLRKWDRPILLRMAQRAQQVAIPDATERVAAVINAIVC